jgi:hypothetical protein
MTETAPRTPRTGRAIASFLLALCLHVVPAWLVLFGPLYGLPDVLEINLDTINLYRERILRDTAAARLAESESLPLLHVSISMPARPESAKRVSKPRSEEDLIRARSVQRAIRFLWEGMSPERPGYALVSLNILEDGSIGESVVNRISGDEEFQSFLLSFLSALKVSYGNMAGSGDALWIECEFVVQPRARKDGS